MTSGEIGIVLGIILLDLFLFGMLLATYIIKSIALYRMAKCRNISKPGLAWVPFFDTWIIGGLADEIDSRRGISKNWKNTLVNTAIIVLGSYALLFFVIILMIIAAVMGNTGFDKDIAIFAILYIFMLVYWISIIVLWVLQIICSYKIFEDLKTEKSVKYIIWSVLIVLVYAICLLNCSKEMQAKEKEMIL